MKKLLLSAVILCGSFEVNAQISTTNVAKEISHDAGPYDCQQNFLKKDFMKYKGQELYLIPKKENLRKYGYENFFKEINKSSSSQSNIFKCCDSYNSKYDDLQGKYFIVEDVLPDPNAYNNSSAYLELKMKETGEKVFYKYDSKYEHSFPFLVVCYYENQKKFYVGNELLIRDWHKIAGSSNQKKILDIKTGLEVEIEKGKYVKCIDVTIDQKYFEPALLLENDKGQQFCFPLYARNLNIQRILTKGEAENYKKRFGEKNWQAILNETVIIGFTEEMTRVAFGEPDKINRASYGDQWVYGDQYYYFKNGKLTSFN